MNPSALNAAKTHCHRGHLLSEDNLDPYALAHGHRQCRVCRNAYHREWQAVRRAAGKPAAYIKLTVGPTRHGSLADRLQARTIMQPGCWGWTGSRTPSGYARIGFGRQTYRAHRASWQVHRGPVPAGLCVLHRCDNPICTNPDHLFLGTDLDNIRDRDAKGRQARQRGEASGAAKLCEVDVRAIRAALGYRNDTALARRYGVTRSLISSIRHRRAWAHLAEST